MGKCAARLHRSEILLAFLTFQQYASVMSAENDVYPLATEHGPEDLKTLARLAGELQQAKLNVQNIEEQLKTAKAKVRDIGEKRIPDLMELIGISDFSTTSSPPVRITVKNVIRASVPASRRFEAYSWLDDHGHGGLIKRSIQVSFDREAISDAKQLQKELDTRFENVREDQKVEPSTLRAWIKEQLSQGEPVPMELFGAWEQRIAHVE